MSRLELVGHTNEHMLNNAAVSATGRVFTSFPRWLGRPTPGVGEVGPDGVIVPYPGNAWNGTDPSSSPDTRFVAIHSIHIDRLDRLWVIDEGKPFFSHPGDIDARPKLVRFDLKTNNPDRVYILDERGAPPGANLAHLRANDRYAFVTDPHLGAIIVIELETGRARRVLEGHPFTAADPSIIPMVDGKPLLAHGKVLVVQVDLLELSSDDRYLYFSALFGPTLYRVPLNVLTNATLTDEEIADHVEKIAKIPPVSGIMEGPDGSLYLAALADRSVLRLRPGSSIPERFIQDETLESPNEGSIGKDNYLYVPASQANLLPAFHNGELRLSPPYCIYRIALPDDAAGVV